MLGTGVILLLHFFWGGGCECNCKAVLSAIKDDDWTSKN